jgi:hypothetical protein
MRIFRSSSRRISRFFLIDYGLMRTFGRVLVGFASSTLGLNDDCLPALLKLTVLDRLGSVITDAFLFETPGEVASSDIQI